MNKITCHSCSNKLEFSKSDELTLKKCPGCEIELKIPKILGEYIFEKLLSSNHVYDTYIGHRTVSEETLVIKVIKAASDISREQIAELEGKLSLLPQENRLTFLKTGGLYTAYRPFIETSIEEYLVNTRPKSDKAIYLLKEIASQLQTLTKSGVKPVDIGIGNILMDNEGRVIISDLLFRESLNEVLKLNEKNSLLNVNLLSMKFLDSKNASLEDTLFSFGCLAYILCCGTLPWPKGSLSLIKNARKISPEVLLKLRDENPEFLRVLIKALINENGKSIISFRAVIEVLNNQKFTVSKKSTPKNKAKISKAAPKVRNRVKKKKAMNPLPLIIGLVMVLAITIIFLSAGSKEPKQAITKAESLPTKKKSSVKKEIKKKAKPKVSPVKKPILKVEKIQEEKVPEIEQQPTKDRASVKAELFPTDLNFDPLVDKLDEYVALTDSKKREVEEEKISLVSTYRDHLLIHFYRKPYTGIFHLHKQKPFRAQIIKADESSIHLKVLKTGKPLVISWNEFEFSQFDVFANYYAAAYANDFSLSEDNNTVFKKAAEEYTKLAVVLDWYGFKEKAVTFKHKSLKFDPSMIDKLNLLINEETTN